MNGVSTVATVIKKTNNQPIYLRGNEPMSDNTQCPECGFRNGLEPNKTRTDDNDVKTDGLYCPDCQTTFDGETTLQWDNIDFPVWVEVEHYDDKYGFKRKFLRSVGLYDGEFNGDPSGREMKYCVFTVWFKVTEDGKMKGPYGKRGGELI